MAKKTAKAAKEDVAEAVGAAQAAANAGTPTEREKRLVKLFQKLDAAQKAHAEVKKKATEKVQAAKAAFRTSIEEGVKNDAERLKKLKAVEAGWQHMDEVKAEAIEDKKHSADHVANADRRLREAIETSAQMNLFEEAGEE